MLKRRLDERIIHQSSADKEKVKNKKNNVDYKRLKTTQKVKYEQEKAGSGNAKRKREKKDKDKDKDKKGFNQMNIEYQAADVDKVKETNVLFFSGT